MNLDPRVNLIPNYWRNYQVVFGTFTAAAAVAVVSLTATHPAIYFMAQLLGGLVVLRAFCLLHDLSHGALFKSRRLNDYFGIAASLLCCVPYFPWKKIHVEHHKWTGWQQNDPTEDNIDFKDLGPIEQFLASWSWRLSLPLIGFSVCIRFFWNLPRLSKLFPARRDQLSFIGSTLIIFGTHAALLLLFGTLYMKTFIIPYLLALFMFDPLMLAQHVGIALIEPGSRELKPVRAQEQEVFARTLLFPKWFSRHVLLGFNYHSAHHVKPTLPSYLLETLRLPAHTHEANWLTWLIEAKTAPISDLLERPDAKVSVS